MKLSRALPFAAGLLTAAVFAAVLPSSSAQVQDDGGVDPQELADGMAAATDYTQPGPHHELLGRFLGEWDTEMFVFMGGQKMGPMKGHATTEWLMDGRWVKSSGSSKMMGFEVEFFSLTGYDNFKRSYVTTTVSSMDTAMNHAEGDVDPKTGALLLYGTVDEYLTGEHDKMVKTVWRFPSDDERVMEIHDLPIGEENAKVIEVRYTRRK